MHSELRERSKDRGKAWVKKVTEFMKKHEYSENNDNEEMDHARSRENQDVRDSLPNLIAKMPQSLITDAMNDQKCSDESSSSIESFYSDY